MMVSLASQNSSFERNWQGKDKKRQNLWTLNKVIQSLFCSCVFALLSSFGSCKKLARFKSWKNNSMHSEHHSLLLRVVVSGWKTSLFFMQTFQELVVGYQFLQSNFGKCYKKTRDIIFFCNWESDSVCFRSWVLVAAQLVKRSLQTLEIHGWLP